MKLIKLIRKDKSTNDVDLKKKTKASVFLTQKIDLSDEQTFHRKINSNIKKEEENLIENIKF